MKTLDRDIDSFSFVQREKKGDKTVSNKCGRDFLYYVMNFYLPDKYNKNVNSPEQIDKIGLFGVAMHPLFAWTQVQFFRAPRLFEKEGLLWYINDIKIKGYWSFVYSILFSRKPYSEAISEIERSVNNNEAVGVDISLGMYGLLDHVLFVYGYDEDNFYVFDTHKVLGLEYEVIRENNYFKLPKSVIKKRWTTFGRVWKLRKLN